MDPSARRVDFYEPLYVGRSGHDLVELGNLSTAARAPISDAAAHSLAVAERRCCGRDGAELRCQLCLWSSSYLPMLRAGRDARLSEHSSCRDDRPVEVVLRLAATISLPGAGHD